MSTKTMPPDGLALAGLGLNKPMLLNVARVLLADVFWDEDREGEYEGNVRDIMDRPETPQVPDELDALMKMSHICGRIEQAWGESFYSVARRVLGSDEPKPKFEKALEDLVYYTIMACIGHGIGPDEIDGFAETGNDPAPIHIENPLDHQLDLLP